MFELSTIWVDLLYRESKFLRTMNRLPHSAPTMQTIASQLGVSRMTVSFALNGTGRVSDEMRQKVLDVARELDFKPNADAQRLKGQRLDDVALFVLWLEPGAGSSKIRLLQELLKEQGYNLPVHCAGLRDSTSEAKQVEVLSSLCRQRPRALIAATGGCTTEPSMSCSVTKRRAAFWWPTTIRLICPATTRFSTA